MLIASTIEKAQLTTPYHHHEERGRAEKGTGAWDTLVCVFFLLYNYILTIMSQNHNDERLPPYQDGRGSTRRSQAPCMFYIKPRDHTPPWCWHQPRQPTWTALGGARDSLRAGQEMAGARDRLRLKPLGMFFSSYYILIFIYGYILSPTVGFVKGHHPTSTTVPQDGEWHVTHRTCGSIKPRTWMKRSPTMTAGGLRLLKQC